MIFRIATVQDASFYDQRVVWDGVNYTLSMMWNGRVGAWYMSLYDSNGDAILLSRKVVTGMPLLDRFRFVAGLPAGDVFALDPSGTIDYAGYDELGAGRGVTLCYYDAEEMAGIRAAI